MDAGRRSVLIEGTTLVLPDTLVEGPLVWAHGKIAGVGHVRSVQGHVTKHRLPGLFVAPGFIDLQVNGGAGFNFGDATEQEMRHIADFHVSHGTTAFLATAVTAPVTLSRQMLQRVRRVRHPAVLGVHLEGPFISSKRKGAQNPEFILNPSVESFDELIQGHENLIKIVTLAPELPEAERLIVRIRELGAIPSLGHSDAGYEEAREAQNLGVALFTHLFNAMRGLHHREPGAVGAALDSDAYVGLICDGVHLHPVVVRLVAKVKGFERICLVTDAISAAGLSDGKYSLGGLPGFVRDGVARLSDGTLAGSTLTMDRAVKNFMEFTGCSLPQAVRCATLNPARLLGIDHRKGSLAVGKDADLVIFDEDLTVHYTILGGEDRVCQDRLGLLGEKQSSKRMGGEGGALDHCGRLPRAFPGSGTVRSQKTSGESEACFSPAHRGNAFGLLSRARSPL